MVHLHSNRAWPEGPPRPKDLAQGHEKRQHLPVPRYAGEARGPKCVQNREEGAELYINGYPVLRQSGSLEGYALRLQK